MLSSVKKLSDTSSNVNKESKRKKMNPREYWTHSKIYKKSVPSKVNIQMKSDNSDTSIKKKQGNERLSFMYRKYQNRKNNTDENFMENSETKSKGIDPYCHQLKRKLSDTSSNVNKESKRKKKKIPEIIGHIQRFARNQYLVKLIYR